MIRRSAVIDAGCVHIAVLCAAYGGPIPVSDQDLDRLIDEIRFALNPKAERRP
jgi:hypothetical protein